MAVIQGLFEEEKNNVIPRLFETEKASNVVPNLFPEPEPSMFMETLKGFPRGMKEAYTPKVEEAISAFKGSYLPDVPQEKISRAFAVAKEFPRATVQEIVEPTFGRGAGLEFLRKIEPPIWDKEALEKQARQMTLMEVLEEPVLDIGGAAVATRFENLVRKALSLYVLGHSAVNIAKGLGLTYQIKKPEISSVMQTAKFRALNMLGKKPVTTVATVDVEAAYKKGDIGLAQAAKYSPRVYAEALKAAKKLDKGVVVGRVKVSPEKVFKPIVKVPVAVTKPPAPAPVPITPAPLAEVVPKAPVKAPLIEEAKTTVAPLKFQDANQEKIIHSQWKASSIRYDFEGAGDIFRELSKTGSQAPSYINEKTRRLDNLIKDYKEGKIHPDDSIEKALKEDPEKIKKSIELWEKQPIETPEQEIARQLNIELLKNNRVKAEELLKQIKDFTFDKITFKLKQPIGKIAKPKAVEGVEVKPKLPTLEKPKEPTVKFHIGVDPGLDKFVAEEVKPTIQKVKDVSKAISKTAKVIPRALINIFEPSKIVEKRLGKEVSATVIRGIHKPEAKEIEFTSKQLESYDANIGELGKWFSKYSDKDLENVMISRGHGLKGDARRLQVKAFVELPKELKDKKIRRAIDEIADFNYKFLQKVAGKDINKVEDYFYGVYKDNKKIAKFLDYWRSTDKFTKQKIFPTVADAKLYGLELKDKNPVANLKREFLAIAKLESMNWMKNELLRTGEGTYIANKDVAPVEWDMVKDPVFKDVRLEPSLAKLINNLISTNKISQLPVLNALRVTNNAIRSFKFIGSAFHLGVEAKQSVADSGYLGFAYKKTALRGITGGFKEKDPIFKTPEYRDYLEQGGGHAFSLESDAQKMLAQGIDKINRGNQLGGALRLGGAAVKLPVTFVEWMFDKYIPKLKYSKYLDFVAEKEQKLGRQLTSGEKQEIVKEGQNFYGMMNERLFGRSGTVTTALRFFFMAPGFAEGNYRTIVKAGLQWGYKGSYGAGRSRFNIVNSLITTVMLATTGTLIYTGKWPKKPETLDDVRDLFKIDTGKKDTRGRKVMIDMLTYDKDYFNVYFNAMRGRPDKAISESIKRIGGMKASTFEMVTDLSMLMQGRALYDWKGDRVTEITDPFLKKALKLANFEIKRIEPISASVFKQSRRKGVDRMMAALGALAGVRTTVSEADKRKTEVLHKMYSLYGQRDDLYRYLGTLERPSERVDEYNKIVNTVLESKIITPDLRNEWSNKLLIDKDRLLSGKVWRLRRVKITDEEALKIEKYIRNWGIKKEEEPEYMRRYKQLRGKRKMEATKISRRKHP